MFPNDTCQAITEAERDRVTLYEERAHTNSP